MSVVVKSLAGEWLLGELYSICYILELTSTRHLSQSFILMILTKYVEISQPKIIPTKRFILQHV